MVELDLNVIALLLTFAVLLAIIIERLIEALVAPWLPGVVAAAVARVAPDADGARVGSWSLLATGILGGLLAAFGFQVDLISPLAVAAGAAINPALGMALTGLLIGGGSNLVHDVFGMARRFQRPGELIEGESLSMDIPLEVHRV
ncbi:MAG: hypothetical protein KKA73_13575 [Chloroflexi bacterium]|nr:hypothetical protein [Chloroflexota bacterium]MBU1748712.1 hypothetical protein [Chloroflexota bacterium]